MTNGSRKSTSMDRVRARSNTTPPLRWCDATTAPDVARHADMSTTCRPEVPSTCRAGSMEPSQGAAWYHFRAGDALLEGSYIRLRFLCMPTVNTRSELDWEERVFKRTHCTQAHHTRCTQYTHRMHTRARMPLRCMLCSCKSLCAAQSGDVCVSLSV